MASSIVIVDDHHLVRNGLKEVIGAHTDLEVVGDFSRGQDALAALAAGTACNVLLLDLSLPDMSGLEILKQVRTLYPQIAVLVLSGHPEAQFGVNVLRAGASGFIGKGAPEAELLRAIRTVSRGGRYVSPEMAGLLVQGLDTKDNGPQHAVLSEREFQIFLKLAEGVTVTEVARGLTLSVKTVSTYRTRILEKMHMSNNADIVTYALKNGLIS